MTSPVLISGAGPVGLTLAVELTRYGVPVRIIDKAAGPTLTSKALVVWSRSLELLDRAGLVSAFLAAGMPASGAVLSSGERAIGRVEFGHMDGPYPYGLMIAQSETERLLTEHLAGQGIRVERQVELVGLDQDAASVRARLRHADGREELVETPYLAGCDGAHSGVRHALDVPFEGHSLDTDWVLGDMIIDHVPVPEDKLAIYFHADGALVLFPMGGKRYRMVADIGPAKGARPADPTLEDLQALMDRRAAPGMVGRDPYWLSAFRINERKVADYRRGRVFLVGDAAHIHSPAGGQGMNTGMQDAFNLAWKLALVLAGKGSDHLLDSYSEERGAVGEQVLRNAGALTRMALLRNPLAQAVRNFALSRVTRLDKVQRTMARRFGQQDIAYGRSRLSVTGPGAKHGGGLPGAGDRVRPDSGPVGTGPVPRFTLFGGVEPVSASALAERFPGLIDPVGRPGPADGGLWLVRPDGYVGLAAGAADLAGVERYLAGL